MGLWLLPGIASAGTVKGKINGMQCAISGFVCPVDKVNAMVALEQDFVVQQPDGTYYTMPNIDHGVKARYALQDVMITGTVNDFYKAIDVDNIQVEQNGQWKTVWSKQMQAEMQAEVLERLFHGSK